MYCCPTVRSCAWLLTASLLLGGCGDKARDPAEPAFRDLYEELARGQVLPVSAARKERLVTVAAHEMPLSTFLQALSVQTGMSFICAAELDSRPVTINVLEAPVSVTLSAVARRLGVQVSQTGDLYFLGNLKPEDRGLLVQRVGHVTPEELQTALQVVLSESGRVAAMPGGVLVVGDRVEVLQKVRELIERLQAVARDTWVIQWFIVDTRQDLLRELGLKTDTSASLSLNLANASALPGQQLGVQLDAVFRAVVENETSDVIARPMALVADGQALQIHSGEEIPIPKRQVYDDGTSAITGYEMIPAGLSIQAQARAGGDETMRLDVQMELSDVTGFREEVPLKKTNRLKTEVTIRHGGVYLLGEVSQLRKSAGRSGGLLALFGRRSESKRLWQIWLRCYRIAGAAREDRSGENQAAMQRRPGAQQPGEHRAGCETAHANPDSKDTNTAPDQVFCNTYPKTRQPSPDAKGQADE